MHGYYNMNCNYLIKITLFGYFTLFIVLILWMYVWGNGQC